MDYREVLRLEPNNKQAQEELMNITKLLDPDEKKEDSRTKEKSRKDESRRKSAKSTKPLKRIVIEEIGSASESEDDATEMSTIAESTPSLPTEEERTNVQQALLTGPSHQAENLKIESKDSPCKMPASSSTARPLPAAPSPSSSSSSTCSQSQSLTSSTRSQSTSKTFTVPKSSGQFQADWRALQKQPDQLFQYFKNIKPTSYAKLFQQSIEPDMLVKIVHLLRDFYMPNGLPVFNEMKHLSEVRRFNMAVMFLSEKDKKVINELLQNVRQNKETLGLNEEDIVNLAKKFGA